ncbi:anti-sigma factor domain-containing protein [Lentibacillus sp. L22]|uniref:anti-sigma-I factor RsgI family protein n=1 Tax=Lentibacillus sp. L22 TaxID=3163028 RepID=UPI003467083F
MRKGIVMEKHRRYTIVMTDNGLFFKTKPLGDTASIGTEVSVEMLERKGRYLFSFYPGQTVKNAFRFIAMAFFLLLFAFPLYVISSNKRTYAYVNIDINPSVELEIDEQMHVRSIKPLNDDANVLMDQLSNYKNEPLDRTVSRIMVKSEQSGLMTHGKKVIVGVSYVKSCKVPVLNKLEQYFRGQHGDWKIVSFRVPEEIRRTAKQQDRAMNEVMAKKFEEGSTKVRKEIEKLKPNEQAIIHSFYQ